MPRPTGLVVKKGSNSRVGLDGLLAAESQELASKRGGPFTGFEDLIRMRAEFLIRDEGVGQH